MFQQLLFWQFYKNVRISLSRNSFPFRWKCNLYLCSIMHQCYSVQIHTSQNVCLPMSHQLLHGKYHQKLRHGLPQHDLCWHTHRILRFQLLYSTIFIRYHQQMRRTMSFTFLQRSNHLQMRIRLSSLTRYLLPSCSRNQSTLRHLLPQRIVQRFHQLYLRHELSSFAHHFCRYHVR